MTEGPPSKYTDLDLLKQIAAQGSISAGAIDKMLNPEARAASTPEEVRALEEQSASLPQETKTAIAHLKVLQALIITAQIRVAQSDPHHYSDGRPVKTPYKAGDQKFEHVWYADPDHPYNQPGATPPGLVMTSTGQVYSLFVAEPNKMEAVELGDEELDRL
jgi:hypothetical protein